MKNSLGRRAAGKQIATWGFILSILMFVGQFFLEGVLGKVTIDPIWDSLWDKPEPVQRDDLTPRERDELKEGNRRLREENRLKREQLQRLKENLTRGGSP